MLPQPEIRFLLTELHRFCERFSLNVNRDPLLNPSIIRIPAKKWGDTEIAERGRSVLVMRARYRSAGLIPHQRGWTDAG